MRPEIISQLRSSGLEWLAALVPTSGSVYGIALIVLTLVFLRRGAIVGLSHNRALELVLVATVGALVGTRLFYLITTGGPLSASVGEWFDLSRGTASWGAYLGGMVGAFLYTRFAGLNQWACIDTAASGVAIGPFVGRWSCFLAGDDFGRVSDVSWALQFPAGSLPFQSHVAADLIPSTAPASLPVHPLQLYLMLNALLVFVVLSAVWRLWRDRPGVTFAAFLLVYGATRFFWEFMRDPDSGGATGILSVSQRMCLVFVTAGAVLLHYSSTRVAAVPPRAI